MPTKKKPKVKKFLNWFERLCAVITRITGSPVAVIVVCILIVMWALSGPLFHFSDTWQLVINTGTTIITFVMVFIIQHSQNKDTMAIQLKLNELIANSGASNRLVSIEDLTEEELNALKKFYVTLAELSKKEKDISCSHSIDEAKENHERKTEKKTKTA